ncbi:MAG: pyridoxal phosphate-dependent aminotransferase [Myxococcota bacterium]
MKLSRRARAIEPTLIRQLRDKASPSSLDLGIGQPDLDVQEPLRRAVNDELLAGRAPYSHNLGLIEAREAVGAHYGVDGSRVMLTVGVQEALAVAILGVVEPGDEVLVPDPGFPAYPNLVRMAGATPVPYTLEANHDFRLDPDAILESITDKTSVVLLNSPANPTGTVIEEAPLRRLLEGLVERDVAWICDEIYEDYVYDGAFASVLDTLDDPRGIKLGGLSKSFHTMGWRLGWLIADEDVVEGLKPLHQHMVTCAPVPAQRAAIAALGQHEELFASTRRVFAARRDLVLELLDDLPGLACAPPQGAFYLFVDARDYTRHGDDSLALAERILQEQDVVVIPGSGFGAAGEGFLRIAYTVAEPKLRDGFDRIKHFFEGLDG